MCVMDLKSEHRFAGIFFKELNSCRGALKSQGLSIAALVLRGVVACQATGTKTEESFLSVLRLAGTVARERADVSEFHFASNERKSISHLNLQGYTKKHCGTSHLMRNRKDTDMRKARLTTN